MTAQTLPAIPQLLTVKQAASALGYRSPKSVYRMFARGELPVVETPAGSKVDAEDIRAYISRHKRVA